MSPIAYGPLGEDAAMVEKVARSEWATFRCYYCGRFLGTTSAIQWIPEPVSVACLLDPPEPVPIHADLEACGAKR